MQNTRNRLQSPSLKPNRLVQAITTSRPGRNTGIACAVAASLLAVTSLQAATYRVDNLNDVGPGSLRAAVLAANTTPDADEILFDSALSGTIHLHSGTVEVKHALTIRGPGKETLTVDGDGVSHIFTITPAYQGAEAEFNVFDMRLSNGLSAIRTNDQGERTSLRLEVRDSIITGNAGAGLVVSFGDLYSRAYLHVIGSTISHNGGDGIVFEGGLYSDSSAAIEDTMITMNQGPGVTIERAQPVGLANVQILNNVGPGIIGSSSQLDISESKISGNAEGLDLNGCASCVFLDPGYFVLESSEVSGNFGAGLRAQETHVHISNTTIGNNQGVGVAGDSRGYVSEIVLDSTTITGNTGGGVVSDNSLRIVNSTISGNQNRPAVELVQYDGWRTPPIDANISHSTLVNNPAGGIVAFASLADSAFALHLSHSLIAGNGATPNADLAGDAVISADYSLVQAAGDTVITETFPGSNIFGVDPLLGPLQDNGGRWTLTHQPLPDSPVIDAGNPDFEPPPELDQRGSGYTRVDNDIIDLGALEVQASLSPFGSLEVDQNWQSLCDANLAPDAILILGPPTHNGGDPGIVRMQAGSDINCPFQVRFQEWDYRGREYADWWHATEQVSYIGLPPGTYYMGDGIYWEVGRFDHFGTGRWRTIEFQNSFSTTPALFLTVQTNNGGQAVTARARNLSRLGFETALFEEEYLMDGHAAESIGYLAIHHSPVWPAVAETGAARFNGQTTNYVLQQTWLNQNWRDLDGVSLQLEEESSLDEEVVHKYESVDVLSIGEHVFAQQVSDLGQDTSAIRRR